MPEALNTPLEAMEIPATEQPEFQTELDNSLEQGYISQEEANEMEERYSQDKESILDETKQSIDLAMLSDLEVRIINNIIERREIRAEKNQRVREGLNSGIETIESLVNSGRESLANLTNESYKRIKNIPLSDLKIKLGILFPGIAPRLYAHSQLEERRTGNQETMSESSELDLLNRRFDEIRNELINLPKGYYYLDNEGNRISFNTPYSIDSEYISIVTDNSDGVSSFEIKKDKNNNYSIIVDKNIDISETPIDLNQANRVLDRIQQRLEYARNYQKTKIDNLIDTYAENKDNNKTQVT